MGMHEDRGVELVPNQHVKDDFVSGFASVELIGGGCVRLVPFIIKNDVRMEADHAIILPVSACADFIGMLVSSIRQPVHLTGDGKIVFMN